MKESEWKEYPVLTGKTIGPEPFSLAFYYIHIDDLAVLFVIGLVFA